MVWIREINVRGPQGPSGGIDPNDPVMVQSVKDAVDARLAAENIARAYPEDASIGYTTLSSVPLTWVHKTLSAPVGDLVTPTVEGEWTGTFRRRGNAAVLSTEGLLDESQIPGSIARKSDIPPAPSPDIQLAERLVSPRAPVFAARVAKARRNGSAVAVVLAGSSTTASQPGIVARFAAILQRVFPVSDKTYPQWDRDAEFTEMTSAGVHVYSAGQPGTTAANFLNDAECDRIAALNPALVQIMIGANDYYFNVEPAQYRSTLEARLAYLDSVLTEPCQFVLVHTYPRWGGENDPAYEYPWSEYRTELEALAATRPDTIVVDLSAPFEAVGVAEDDHSDPLGLISADDVHMTPDGERFMADSLGADITS